jgi:hypothetical protein
LEQSAPLIYKQWAGRQFGTIDDHDFPRREIMRAPLSDLEKLRQSVIVSNLMLELIRLMYNDYDRKQAGAVFEELMVARIVAHGYHAQSLHDQCHSKNFADECSSRRHYAETQEIHSGTGEAQVRPHRRIHRRAR